MPIINTETRSGDSIRFGNRTLVPFSRSFTLRFPGRTGGLIWNRPVSILSVSDDGQEEVIPIHDVTRQVQLSLLAASLISTILYALVRRKIRSS